MDRMLQIATVDDMQEAREHLAKKIKDYLDNRWLKYELFQYESGYAFISALENQSFDIVFMDIYMSDMTGIEAAAKLRMVDMDCKLVFVTSTTDFLGEGYSYNPCHYLVKPFAHDEFEQAMHNCQIKRQVDVPYLDIVFDSITSRIDTTEIMYLNISKRIVLIHTTTGDIPAGRGFAEIAEPLMKDSRFLACIQGVLVNMDFISAVEKNVFLLKNGTRLQMTVRDRRNLIKQYRNYQFERASSRGVVSL